MGNYRIVYTADAVRDHTARLNHHGVKGQKWGVIRTPQQLGHKKPKKKTYEVKKPSKAKIVLAMMFPFVSVPILLASEAIKRSRDPEYARKIDEYMAKNRSKWVSTLSDQMQSQQRINENVRFNQQMLQDSMRSVQTSNHFMNQMTINHINSMMF